MSKEDRQAVFLVNAHSRRGDAWFDQASTALKARGIELRRAEKFSKVKKLTAAAKQAIEAHTPLLIVGGGDGTFSSIAGLLAHSETTLGVLPLGTGNAFARDLGIETDLDFACDTIAHGNVVNVDMGNVNRMPFLNVATVGLSTLIVKELDPNAKRLLGPLAYLFALIRAVRRVRPFEASIRAEGVNHTFRSLQVVIGNGRFHAGPFLIAPDASVSSGQLVVYALETSIRGDLIRFALAVRRGEQSQLDNVCVFRLKEGSVETSPLRQVTIDGEPSMNTPVTFGVSPGALRVLAPAT